MDDSLGISRARIVPLADAPVESVRHPERSASARHIGIGGRTNDEPEEGDSREGLAVTAPESWVDRHR
jgi:hypothetical protein